MSIPRLVPGPTSEEILPLGRHPTTFAEIQGRFVKGLPDDAVRQSHWDDFEALRAQQSATVWALGEVAAAVKVDLRRAALRVEGVA